MAKAFNKGINVVTGFSLGEKAPLDYRYTVATIADRNAHVTNNRAYEGMLVYVEADHTIYKYTGSEWVAFGVTQDTVVSVSGDVVSTSFHVGDRATESLTMTLSDIVSAGTACKITFNAKGLVTSATSLSESDIPSLHAEKISDAGSSIYKDAALSGAGKVLLIGEDGKISNDVLPALALTQISVVNNESEMLALTAQPGDVAVRNDLSKTFMLSASPADTLANWVELKTPVDVVQSVNGQTGTVVLGTDEVAEGSTNLYWTEARGTANFTANFALASSTSLADTANIVYVGDAIAATCITEDTTHRFITDAERTRWNSTTMIVVGNDAEGDVGDLSTGDFYYEITE